MQVINHRELAEKYPNSAFIFIDRKTAVIIDKEFEWLRRYSWHLDSRGYVKRSIKIKNSYRKGINGFNGRGYKYLHQEILPPKDGFVTDHINGDILDNRKENLRYATYAQNVYNSAPINGKKYKGIVKVETKTKPIRYKVLFRKKSYGYYDTPEEAALKYNEVALKEYGEFARLNKID